jgi:hypothetical protein
MLMVTSISRVRTEAPSPEVVDPQPEMGVISNTAAPSPQVTPRKPMTVPLKTGDGGPSPARSTPRARKTVSTNSAMALRDTDAETVVSDRLSVMSFAYSGSDQIKPKPRPQPLSSASNNNKMPTSPKGGAQRRASNGHVVGSAANTKFAHRLRSPVEDTAEGDITVRPNSRIRRSLPPAMLQSDRALNDGNRSTSGRITPSVVAGEVKKPAWNAGTAPKSPNSTVRVRQGSALGKKVTPVKRIDASERGVGEEGSVAGLGIWSTYQENEVTESEVGRARAVVSAQGTGVRRGGKI